MKILTVAIMSSAAALMLAGCSGNHGKFDTNGAEYGAERTPGETNLMVAQRTGASLDQFTYVEPMENEQNQTPVATPHIERNSDTTPTRKTDPKVEVATPAPAEENLMDTTSYQSTTTASSVVEEAPKTKKELRKEKKEARKAARKNN